jgi:hypothetical protein
MCVATDRDATPPRVHATPPGQWPRIWAGGLRVRSPHIPPNLGCFGSAKSRVGTTTPPRPEAREGEKGSVLAQREPCRGLAGSGWRVFAERCRWHEAPVLRRKPAAPVRARDVADVGDRLTAKLRRSRHAPARHDLLTPRCCAGSARTGPTPGWVGAPRLARRGGQHRLRRSQS